MTPMVFSLKWPKGWLKRGKDELKGAEGSPVAHPANGKLHLHQQNIIGQFVMKSLYPCLGLTLAGQFCGKASRSRRPAPKNEDKPLVRQHQY
ncbi:hypothetical protein INR49_029976 [Caranx melampygus]|nr:hypothetical protein INR49_029976 [Caranx melampygus]